MVLAHQRDASSLTFPLDSAEVKALPSQRIVLSRRSTTIFLNSLVGKYFPVHIEHYQKAIRLTEQAIEQNISIEELQTEFTCLNLEIRDTVEFKPARKPFDGRNPYRGLEKFTEADHEFFLGAEWPQPN
jgi:hypothetical protein